MLDKTLIRAPHTFRNAHDAAGFTSRKKAPFFRHFTHLLEAASAELGFKAWNQESVTSCYSHPSHSDAQRQQRKCQVRETFFHLCLFWHRQQVRVLRAALRPTGRPALLWRPRRRCLQRAVAFGLGVTTEENKSSEVGARLWLNIPPLLSPP